MIKRLKTLFGKRMKVESSTPLREAFDTTGAWLAAWVARRQTIFTGSARMLDGLDPTGTVYLFGSLGYDSALSASGSVWVREFDLDAAEAPPWHEASELERSSAIVSASHNFPELRILLPARPASAVPCEQCEGTGFTLAGFVTCRACGALGWRASEAT